VIVEYSIDLDANEHRVVWYLTIYDPTNDNFMISIPFRTKEQAQEYLESYKEANS
jgi:hypothetical protein